MGLRLRRLLGLEWEVWHIVPGRREVQVAEGLSRFEAECLAGEWTADAVDNGVDWRWEARRTPRWRR